MMKAKQIPEFLATSSSLRVIEVDPRTDQRWEAFLESIPACLIYYHPIWLQMMEEAYGYKTVYLVCEDTTGQVVGILPLIYQNGRRTGRTLRSVFTGPLIKDDRASAALLQASVERTRAEPGVQLHFKLLSNTHDDLLHGLVGVPMYETFQLTLPKQPELLRLDSTIKRAVNKATRLGVEVRQAQTEGELRAWYELYLQTMRKLFALPNSYRYFELAWKRLHPQGLLRLLLAEHVEAGQRRLLGGILLLAYGQTISFAAAGWREEDQALRANDILHWRAIQDACTEGFGLYDFGDVELGNLGLARYKSKWGAEAKMVYDYSYPVSHNRMHGTNEQSRNLSQQLVQAVWPHLPTKTLGLLSNWFYALRLY